MIRIAACEPDKATGNRLRGMIDAYLRQLGLFNSEVLVVGSYTELGAVLSRLRPGFVDLCLCRIEINADDSARERLAVAVQGLRDLSPSTRFILVSSAGENALCAYLANVSFLKMPFEEERFKAVVGGALNDIAEDHHARFAVKASKGVSNMNLNDIAFVETGKKGPVIHLPAGREVVTRGSLQALYDRLSGLDNNFVRAGGSFIINLSNVRSVGDSSVVFGDGSTIILPTRARKPIQESFAAYRLRKTEAAS